MYVGIFMYSITALRYIRSYVYSGLRCKLMATRARMGGKSGH